MRNLFSCVFVCTLGLSSIGFAEAQTSPFAQIMKARRLYACSSFLRASAGAATDTAQKDTLSRSYARFLTQATIEALAAYPDDPGGPQLAKAIGDSGQQDFERFMATLDSISTVEERNAKIGQYGNVCIKRIEEASK